MNGKTHLHCSTRGFLQCPTEFFYRIQNSQIHHKDSMEVIDVRAEDVGKSRCFQFLLVAFHSIQKAKILLTHIDHVPGVVFRKPVLNHPMQPAPPL